MPERGRPASPYATPAARPTSSNLPLPLLTKRKLGIVSLATNRSIHPSLFTSVLTTPNDLPGESAIPDSRLTSVKVPLPLLRNRCDGIGLKRRGRSEEHTSELQSRGLISYAVFCLKK